MAEARPVEAMGLCALSEAVPALLLPCSAFGLCPLAPRNGLGLSSSLWDNFSSLSPGPQACPWLRDSFHSSLAKAASSALALVPLTQPLSPPLSPAAAH